MNCFTYKKLLSKQILFARLQKHVDDVPVIFFVLVEGCVINHNLKFSDNVLASFCFSR